MKLRHLLIVGLAFNLIHCSKDSNTNTDDGDSSVIDLPIKLKPDAKLDGDKKQVGDLLEAKKAISFRQVTKLMIERHVKAANNPDVTSQKIQEFIRAISPSSSLSPAKTKVHYEEKISKKHGGKPLIYNASKNNIVDVYSENRVQCYSGTYLYEIVRRQQKPSKFRAGNEVVIFASGHVLPGYMIKKDGAYVLMGIETTVKGGGRYYYGEAKYLGSSVKVIDAELFALAEIFADDISNPVEVANAALKYTAKKYGIEGNQDYQASASGGSSSTSAARELNQSIFAFGQADTSPVDKERSESGDDVGKADTTYWQGMKVMGADVQEKPRERLIEEIVLMHNCEPINGRYIGLEKEGEYLYVSMRNCNLAIISSFSSSERSKSDYSVEDIRQVSANALKFDLKRQAHVGVPQESATFVYNKKTKQVVLNGKVYDRAEESNSNEPEKRKEIRKVPREPDPV